jgi:transcriptional regulator
MIREISEAEAIEKIKKADGALIVVQNIESVPSIGEVPPGDQKVEITTESFKVEGYTGWDEL